MVVEHVLKMASPVPAVAQEHIEHGAWVHDHARPYALTIQVGLGRPPGRRRCPRTQGFCTGFRSMASPSAWWDNAWVPWMRRKLKG